jgi:phage-related baseplate assembly protein
MTRRTAHAALVVAACTIAVVGCKDAAKMANKAMTGANEALAKKAAYEYMVAYMGQDFAKCYDLSTAERQDELEKKSRKLLKLVKPGSERKRLRRAGGREMVAGVMAAAKEKEEYPRMSDFSIDNDSWTFNEDEAEVDITIDEMQEDRSKTSRTIRMTLVDKGDAWLVSETEDEE